ncbi:MAG: hypothetical protein ACLFUB_20975 [Cyclobacteriaceae bacterium]
MQKVLDIHFPMIDYYLDNLLAMPIILTLLLVERRILFRRKTYRLSVLEIVMATLLIILVAEIVFPLLSRDFTTDWWDVVFYVLGSLIFYLTINRSIAKRRTPNRS